MLVLEGVLLVGARLAWRATPSSWLGLRGRLRLCHQCVLSFSLERRIWRVPCQLFGSGLIFSVL